MFKNSLMIIQVYYSSPQIITYFNHAITKVNKLSTLVIANILQLYR